MACRDGIQKSRAATAERDAGYDWARDANPLFTFLGLYLATFQSIEGRLDQIILLGAGLEKWEETQVRLSRMDNRSKIEAVALAAADTERFPLVAGIGEWHHRLEKILAELHDERRRRNAIMHSQYLLESLELGAAIRSSRTPGADLTFDREHLGRPRMGAILREIAALALASAQIHVQLIHAVARAGHEATDSD